MDGRAPGRAGWQSAERREGAGVPSERPQGRQAEESSYCGVRAATCGGASGSLFARMRFVVSQVRESGYPPHGPPRGYPPVRGDPGDGEPAVQKTTEVCLIPSPVPKCEGPPSTSLRAGFRQAQGRAPHPMNEDLSMGTPARGHPDCGGDCTRRPGPSAHPPADRDKAAIHGAQLLMAHGHSSELMNGPPASKISVRLV